MDFEAYRQAVTDEAELRYLPILYWISGGLVALYGLFMLVYFAFIGTVFVAAASSDTSSSAPPAWLGWVFVGVAIVGLAIVATLATFKILAGFWIRDRKRRTATMIVAAISCLEVPYGTLLGVMTFLVLGRPSVKALFAGAVVAGDGMVAPPAPVEPLGEEGVGGQPVT